MFEFFWKTESPFSQWHSSTFEVDGISYNCCEQFMMASKARLFGDEAVLKLIMATDDPRYQKQLGRTVKNFELETWNNAVKDILKIGNLAKFRQNSHLKDKLLATENELVEASPYDKIYGIGLSATDPRAKNKETWLGTNWLGEVLTEVREIIRSKDEISLDVIMINLLLEVNLKQLKPVPLA